MLPLSDGARRARTSATGETMGLRLAKLSELAPVLRVTERTVYRMAQEGRLPGLVRQRGGQLRVNLYVFEAAFTPRTSRANDATRAAA